MCCVAMKPASWAITTCSANWPSAAKRVLPADIRLSIRQVALHRVDGAAEALAQAEAVTPEQSR